jgi:RNA polymerase sigma factor (sigma-70 family)
MIDTSSLPVMRAKKEFLSALHSHQVIVVVGSTGSGKTTQLPQFLIDAEFAQKGMVACTEPRRIAAIAAATRVAEERNTSIGKEIGYQIRFEKKIGPDTKLKYVTSGILLREALYDPMLSAYSCVVLDEAHERDIFGDFLLGYLKRVCQKRSEFRVVILSATIQYQELASYFPNLYLLKVLMREFPVKITYAPIGQENPSPKIEELVKTIHATHASDRKKGILVFLPGEREIKYVIERIRKMNLANLQCFPLYGRLAPKEQRKIFEPYDGLKVVVATNVAETSLTIEGITHVIDIGLARVQGFDLVMGVETLTLEKISQSEAVQRAGRAGRTGPGTCIRLYSEEDFLSRPKFRAPMIARADLTNLVFAMKSLGLNAQFDFMTKPPDELWSRAEEQLRFCGAIDGDGMITEHGDKMLALAIEPKLARLILGSVHYGCVEEAVIMAAMLSIGRFFVSEFYDSPELERVKEKFRDPGSDFFTLLNIWDDYEKSEFSESWCIGNYLNPYWMEGVRTVRNELREVLKRQGIELSSSRNTEVVGKAILSTFRSQVLRFKKGENYSIELGLSHIFLFGDSVLADMHRDYVVCYNIKYTTKLFAHCNHAIPHEWLTDHSPTSIALTPVTVPVIPKQTPMELFLSKPISELRLPETVEMKLWSVGIQTIGELTSQTVESLLKELKELFETTTGAEVVREVQDRLAHFDLMLVREKSRRREFNLDSRILNLPPATPLDDERAAQVLGEDQFPLFKRFRQCVQEYRQTKSEEAKIAMEEARNAIVVLHYGLPWKWARMKYPELKRVDDPSMDFDDLVQEGQIGLLMGVERFDYTRGFRFSTYGSWWVRQAIGRAFDDQRGVPVHMMEKMRKFSWQLVDIEKTLGHPPTREEVAQALEKPVEEIEQMIGISNFYRHFFSLDHVMEGNGQDGGGEVTLKNLIPIVNESPLEEIERSEMRRTLQQIFEEVPFLDVEMQCLELYFGLNGNDPHTLDEIGGYLGVTRERVRQRLEIALTRLRTPRVWELAHQHVKGLPKPSLHNPKFEVEVGDTVADLKKIPLPVLPKPTELQDPEQQSWSAIRIMGEVAQNYGFTTRDLLGISRAGDVARARQVAMYRIREELGMSFPKIGEIFSRDHSTVMHAYNAIKSEVVGGAIPLGCFPLPPTTTPEAVVTDKVLTPEGRKTLSLDELLNQDLEVLDLAPSIAKILRNKRKAKQLRDLIEAGRDRLLMTEQMDEGMLEQIEIALRREGLVFAQ